MQTLGSAERDFAPETHVENIVSGLNSVAGGCIALTIVEIERGLNALQILP